MLSPDVFMAQAFGLLSAVREHPLALMTQRQIHRSRHLFADCRVGLNLLTNRFDGSV